MAERELIDAPSLDHIRTEDETPMDNIFSERQQRLLVQSLYTGWKPKDADSFLATQNVGLFYGVHFPPLVPDFLLSLDVKPAQGDELYEKRHRSYFLWEHGKPPEIVGEIVSNKDGGEFGEKLKIYARIGVWHYFVYDPARLYGGEALQLFCFNQGRVERCPDNRFERVGLQLTIWHGTFENSEANWLRWLDANGKMLPTIEEVSAKANRLAEKLRELGINPDDV
ncbi:MAG: Uma2 family endonuclease [Chloroherpetonaceae bacterium]|nr:Uma2 family endonuclease [Chloroherpetonaceae bacterium]MDW8437912.1 Uma2 family endonuclease [Chloroherpetonaceae bacterium]